MAGTVLPQCGACVENVESEGSMGSVGSGRTAPMQEGGTLGQWVALSAAVRVGVRWRSLLAAVTPCVKTRHLLASYALAATAGQPNGPDGTLAGTLAGPAEGLTEDQCRHGRTAGGLPGCGPGGHDHARPECGRSHRGGRGGCGRCGRRPCGAAPAASRSLRWAGLCPPDVRCVTRHWQSGAAAAATGAATAAASAGFQVRRMRLRRRRGACMHAVAPSCAAGLVVGPQQAVGTVDMMNAGWAGWAVRAIQAALTSWADGALCPDGRSHDALRHRRAAAPQRAPRCLTRVTQAARKGD
eukprot:363620-Chlamydomonas_euryale.AAC.13